MLAKCVPVEVTFTALMLAVLLGLSAIYGLPIRMPAAGGAEFVGIHYLLPLIGLLIWTVCVRIGTRTSNLRTIVVALPCYTGVLFVHFHLKLWTPIINPQRYDNLY